MADELSFDEILKRTQAGNQEAAAILFHRYAQRLFEVASRRLDSVIGPKVSPEDVVQSVLLSFFRRHAEGQFDVKSEDSLWALLVTITRRKCGRWNKKFRTTKRQARRETPLQAPPDDSMPGNEPVGREPTPSEAMILAETVEQLMDGLKDRDRQIVSLCLQGYSTPEISERVGRTERTVQRKLEHVRKHLTELHAEVEAEA